MKMKYVYVIEVINGKTGAKNINQIAYSTLEKAQEFCAKRGDKPIKINNYTYLSKDYNYIIHDLAIDV